MQRKSEAAVAPFQEAVNLALENALSHTDFGDAFRAQKNYDLAIKVFREALRLDPKNAAAHSGLADVFNDQGEYDAAISEHRDALRLEPKAGTHFSLGLVYYKVGLNTYRKGRYFDNGRFDMAIAEFRDALSIDRIIIRRAQRWQLSLRGATPSR